MIKDSNPIVSVIINCFNGSKFIEKAIESVLAQSYKNLEIIVWDNQSTDNSANIVNSYNDKRIRYFYAPKHTQLYEARNHAISKSIGTFISFLDCDDWWEHTKIYKQVKKFDEDDYAIVYSNMRLVFDKKTRFGKRVNKLVCKFLSRNYVSGRNVKTEGFILDQILKKYIVGLPSIMINKKYFTGFDEKYHIIGDMDFVLKTAAEFKLGYIDENLAYYRVHGFNESFLKRDLQIKEWKIWYENTKKNSLISKFDSFNDLKYKVLYLEAMEHISNKRIKMAYECLLKFPLSMWKLKLKIIIVILSPNIIVKIFRT